MIFNKCTFYCRDRDCLHRCRDGLFVGTCSHPDHLNVWARDGISQMVLVSCPRRMPVRRFGDIVLDRAPHAFRYVLGAPGSGKSAGVGDILDHVLSEDFEVLGSLADEGTPPRQVPE